MDGKFDVIPYDDIVILCKNNRKYLIPNIYINPKLLGIGETIRVSLTEDPVREIKAAQDILKCIGKRGGPQIVSCPTCGRTRIDLVKTAKEVEAALEHVEKDIKVAVMGCVVNGPGEAREADIGIAGGDGCAVLFRKGTVLRKVAEEEIVPELLAEIEKL